MSQRLRGVIFDVDGTLVNSNDAHARAWVEALAEANIHVELADVRRCIGMGGDKLLPAVANLDESSTLGQRLSQRRGEIFRERYLPELRPFPQTRELLLKLRQHGLKIGVASSAKAEELQPLLELARVADLIEKATSSKDAQASKPDPDIVSAALSRLDLPPERVIMVGDTPYDIQAASSAGLRAIAVRCGGRSDRDLSGAIAIYDDPADLLAKLDESAFGTER